MKEPTAEAPMRWTMSMKLLLGFVTTLVVVVVAIGGLLFSLSGPSPLTTQAVNFDPTAVTSVIDHCTQDNGLLRVSGTTTATASVSPTLVVFAVDDANDSRPQHSVHISELRPGETASWKVALSERRPVSGCGVGTLTIGSPFAPAR